MNKKTIKKTALRSRTTFKKKRSTSLAKHTAGKRLALWFVPHKNNQYRPHAIRRYGLVIILLVIIGIQAGYNVALQGGVLGERRTISPAALLAYTNSEREANGMSALTANSALQAAAQQKAQDMLQRQYWSHDAPDGTSPWFWFDKAGYNYAYAGENLAKNFASAEATVAAWMASPEHRANILDTHYEQAGFAVVKGVLKGEPTDIVVALYGQPASSASVAGVKRAALVVDAPAPTTLSPLARFAVVSRSLSPAAILALGVVMGIVIIALVSHMYRKRLPAALRATWYRHHGVIKAGGMMVVGVFVLLYSSGGQL